MPDRRATKDKIRDDDAPAAAEAPAVSRALSGPLAALGAIRYELGRDEVWVIGRLPEIGAGSRRARRPANR